MANIKIKNRAICTNPILNSVKQTIRTSGPYTGTPGILINVTNNNIEGNVLFNIFVSRDNGLTYQNVALGNHSEQDITYSFIPYIVENGNPITYPVGTLVYLEYHYPFCGIRRTNTLSVTT